MSDYKTVKEIYHDLPKWLKPIFWLILIVIIFIGYIKHYVACSQNKQDEFLWCLKCYPKLDTIEVFKEKIVYRDTCNSLNSTIDGKDNKGVQSFNQKGGQTANEIHNN